MLEAFEIFNIWFEFFFTTKIDGVTVTVIFLVAIIIGWAINVLTNYVGKG